MTEEVNRWMEREIIEFADSRKAVYLRMVVYVRNHKAVKERVRIPVGGNNLITQERSQRLPLN